MESISLQFQFICLETSVVVSFEAVEEPVLELLPLVAVVLDTVEVMFKSFSEVVKYSLVAVSNSAEKLFRDVVVQRVVLVVFAVLEVLLLLEFLENTVSSFLQNRIDNFGRIIQSSFFDSVFQIS